MSIVELRIELPTYARSFVIQIPDTCTILEVKQEIFRTCPGRPRVDGQKLIWRGRFLADNEKVEAIWKSLNEPRIVQLAVHPTAWASGPPTVQQTSALPTTFGPEAILTNSTPQPTQSTTHSSAQSSSAASRLPFVVAKHQEALTALTEGRANPGGMNAMPRMREDAVKLLEGSGWSWPQMLDEPYPEQTPGGLEYERLSVGDTPYLSLKNPSAYPTPFQAHALRVLGYTFSILSKELGESRSQPSHTITQTIPEQQTIPNIPHINDLLQQMGLPPLRNVPNANAVPVREQVVRPPNPFQDMPIRPLLAPLFMLILRTSLLLYFVAPTRKPIFGVLILAWMLYEIWQPIRNNLLRQIRQNEQDAQQNNAQERAAPGQAGAAPEPDAPEANIHPVQGGPQTRAVMEMLGNMNIESERRMLAQASREDPMEPGLGHKAVTFFGLLLTTLHPAIWNQRRVALRRREGIIRTEINIRDGEPRTDLEDEEARQNEERAEEARTAIREMHERRPEWVQRYMTRVMSAEWVDDAD